MPTFCRHGRLEATCPICARKAQRRGRRPSRAGRRLARRGRRPRARSPSPRGGDLRVRRMARAADDGYEHELLPGLRSSLDAARLADEIAFAAARLDELSADPPGLYADVAARLRRRGGHVAGLPHRLPVAARGRRPVGVRSRVARTSWASGELPMLEDVALGPRAAHDPARGASTLLAYRAWAERAGSQAQAFTGDPAWPDQRRFDRAFERLSLPGFGRAPRYELLVVLGRLGVYDVRPWSLQLSARRARSHHRRLQARARHRRPAAAAAPRGRARRRPSASRSRRWTSALTNWSRPEGERITAGATVGVGPTLPRRDAIGAALGVETV